MITTPNAACVFFLLMGAHALCDFSLQSDSMARGKSRSSAKGHVPWWAWLSAHALIHGSAVAAVTGVWWLGLAETMAHAATDFAKCEGRISFIADQIAHVACKALWVLALVTLAASQ